MSDESYRVSQAPQRPNIEIFSPLRPLRHFAADTLSQKPLDANEIEGNLGCLFAAISLAIAAVSFFVFGDGAFEINRRFGAQIFDPIVCACWCAFGGLLTPTGVLLFHRYLQSVMHFDDAEVREWWLAKIRGS